MIQSEIDEISEAFMDAWEEYFGQMLYYVSFDEISTKNNAHPLYRDVKKKGKIYLWDDMKPFHGTLKSEEVEEKGDMFGKDEDVVYNITLITKELRDQGILTIDKEALIYLVDRDGINHVFNITALNQKVQFGDNKVFTKLKVQRVGSKEDFI